MQKNEGGLDHPVKTAKSPEGGLKKVYCILNYFRILSSSPSSGDLGGGA